VRNSSDFPTFEICALQLTSNFLLKLLHFRTTNYMHFSHRGPPHHKDTALDGVHTPLSSLDTPPIFLIVISLLASTVIRSCIFAYCLFLYTVYWLAFCHDSYKI